MRVRSHSMETVAVSHRHRGPGLGSGVSQNSMECTKSTYTVSRGRAEQGTLDLLLDWSLLRCFRACRNGCFSRLVRLHPPHLLRIQPPVMSAKSPLKSPVKRRSGLFPRLHSSSESQADRHSRGWVPQTGISKPFQSQVPVVSSIPVLSSSICFHSDQKSSDSSHSQEVRSDTLSNPSSPEICPNKER